MSVLTASATPSNGALRHRVDVNRRHTITTDEPEYLGGSDAGPAPHELLPAMVAACVSTMIVLYAERRGWELGDVRVDVSYESETEPRELEVTIHLPEGLTPDQVTRLERVADTCPVKRAFEAGFSFERRLVLDLPGRANQRAKFAA
ncbi:MAG TPA: OsmC family protein [Solirubrobacteraceae bacterium]|nr:OsmC family protein [Solirubrobacteraceae bacterium]